MFIEEYLKDLRAQRFRPDALARYVSRAWQRGKSDIAANPGASRSIVVLGLALFGAAFAGCVALALSSDLVTARRVLLWSGLWLLPLTAGLLLHVGLLRDRDGYSLSAVNLPTALTAARLAVVPALAVTLLTHHWRAAFWIFIAAMWSDVLDGWLARRLRQETRLGTIFDPVTDIIFGLALFLSLGAVHLVGPWVVALAVFRFGGLLVGGAILNVFYGPVRVNSTLPGKVSGFIMGVLLGFLLLGPSYGAGRLGPILTPLAQDGAGVLLAGGVVHGAFLAWHNRRAIAEAQAEKVIRDVRFGPRPGA